jgi:uncharacterized protein (DUF1330 family)
MHFGTAPLSMPMRWRGLETDDPGKDDMSKAYWISAYRSIRDEVAVAAYAKLAGPALVAAGGRFLARGLPAQVYEGGLEQRTVVIEFDSVAQAIAAHDSPAYQQALQALGSGAERDLRIIEGVG